MISKRKITTITFHFLSFRSMTRFEINIERFGKKLFSKISTNNRSNLNRDLKFWLFQGRRRNRYNWLEINGKRFRKIQQTDSIPRVDSLYSKWYVKFHDHEALFGYGSISKVAPFSFVLLGRRIFHVEKDSTIVSIHRWPINRCHTTLPHPLFEGVGSSNVLPSPQTWRNIIIIIIASWNDNPFGNLF